jgi:hypothetical protein
MTKKQIKNLIIKIYKEREKAHDKLLECDVLLDKLITELYEEI